MATIIQKPFTPRVIYHPGVTLAEKLEELGMSAKEFSVRTKKPEKTINAVLKGNSSLTPDMAVAFESVTGIPANFWITLSRKISKSLLTETSLSVSQVGESVGFVSSSHFSHIFRKTEGCTPSEYRKQHKPDDEERSDP